MNTLGNFRLMAFAFACILGGFSLWILAAEAVRPANITFTADPQLASSIYGRRDAAIRAARLGLVRGDLWSEAAFAYGDILLSQDHDTGKDETAQPEDIRFVIENAVANAPYNPRLWLLLAADYFRADRLSERAADCLKMSYYTGSSTLSVVPSRLLFATQSRAISDRDFQELVRDDIRIAVMGKARLLPAIRAAYKRAPTGGRAFIEKTLAELDPSILASIRSEGDRTLIPK